MNLFPNLPSDASVWIYAANRPLRLDEQATLMNQLDTFFQTWTSHQRPVRGAAAILHDRFLLVAAHIEGGDLSGCGIDKSARTVETLASRLGIQWASPLLVFFRDSDGSVQAFPRPAFRQAVKRGAITAETPVFDTTVSTLGALREGAFEQPAGAAWHGRVFRIPQPA